MHKYILRRIIVLAALLVSGLAVAMAWASAMQRSTGGSDQVFMAALSVAFVMAVHLLPAMRRWAPALVVWPMWILCLALAGFGHASWFYLVSESAAEARIAGSAAVAAAAQERAAIEQTLGTIKSRPVATVAAQLARTTDPDRREALALELAEARRAAGLRDRLIVLSGTAAGTLQVHPGTPGYGSGTAGTESGTGVQIDMTMVMSVVAAVVIELLGALLWSAALRVDDDAKEVAKPIPAPAPTVVQQVVNDVADEVAVLRAAIERGECRSSVRSIKEYMACGSDAAARLRRQLIDS